MRFIDANEFGSDMLRISGTAAIPAQQYFLASLSECRESELRPLNLAKLRPECGMNHFEMFFKGALKQGRCGQGL